MRRLLAVLLALGATALAGCRGGPSKSSFLTEADDACRNANAPVASLRAPGSFSEVADGAGKLATATADQVPMLSKLDRPGGARVETDAVFSAIAAVGPAATSLREAAAKSDERATAAAAIDLSTKARQAGDGARAYGFFTCGAASQTAATSLTDGTRNVIKARFVSKAEDLCEAVGEQFEGIEVGTASQALRIFSTLVTAYTKLKTDINALVVPPGDEGAVNEFLEAAQKLIDKVSEFRDAIPRGNSSILEALLKDLSSLNTQANAKADAYGIKACGTLSEL